MNTSAKVFAYVANKLGFVNQVKGTLWAIIAVVLLSSCSVNKKLALLQEEMRRQNAGYAQASNYQAPAYYPISNPYVNPATSNEVLPPNPPRAIKINSNECLEMYKAGLLNDEGVIWAYGVSEKMKEEDAILESQNQAKFQLANAYLGKTGSLSKRAGVDASNSKVDDYDSYKASANINKTVREINKIAKPACLYGEIDAQTGKYRYYTVMKLEPGSSSDELESEKKKVEESAQGILNELEQNMESVD